MNNLETMVIERLMKLQVFKRQAVSPFLWANGWKSPIYCDDKKILSYPKERDFFKIEISRVLMENFPTADVVAAVATNAIAQGILVAEQLNMPFVYVYPKPKDHGLENQIEGDVRPGQNVVVIENQVNLGVHAMNAVEALRMNGCKVLGVLTIIDYEIPSARKLFEKAGVPLVAMTTFTNVLEYARKNGQINQNEYEAILQWHRDPAKYKE